MSVRFDQLTNDVKLLKRLVNDPKVLRSDVRAIVSPILRRWINENGIVNLQKERNSEFLFSTTDRRKHERFFAESPPFLFLAIEGEILGKRFSEVLVSRNNQAIPKGFAPLEAVVGIAALRNQRVIYYGGRHAKREEVIEYSANKDGGVHLDFSRSKDVHNLLDEARGLIGLSVTREDTVQIELRLERDMEEHRKKEDNSFLDAVTTALISTANVFCTLEERERFK